MRLFISYAHSDQVKVKKIVDLLRLSGHEVWFDESLVPGQDWKAELEKRIIQSDIFVYMMTSRSLASEWCQWEYRTAIQNKKSILPILVEKTKLPKKLSRLQYADFSKKITPTTVAKLGGGLANLAQRISLENAPNAPENPAGAPAGAVTYSEIHDINISGDKNKIIIQQVWGDPQRDWTLPVIIGLIIGFLSLIFTIFAILPEDTKNDIYDVFGVGTPQPTLTLEPTPLPILQSLFLPALENIDLRDIAAANEEVWLATEHGLYHYKVGQAEVELLVEVSGTPLSRVAVDKNGVDLWFSQDTGEIGHYTTSNGQVEWFLPATTGISRAITIEIGSDGAIWFGDETGAIIYYTPQQQWQVLPPPVPLDPFDRLYDTGLTQVNSLTSLWVIRSVKGPTTAFHWQEGRWNAGLAPTNICKNESCAINVVGSDAQQRAWFGHSEGITMYSDSLDGPLAVRDCIIPELSFSNTATDISITGEGTALWVVTRGGLARLDLLQERLPIGCDEWQWDTWEEEGTDFRIAADEGENRLVIWLLDRETDKIRWLKWQ